MIKYISVLSVAAAVTVAAAMVCVVVILLVAAAEVNQFHGEVDFLLLFSGFLILII